MKISRLFILMGLLPASCQRHSKASETKTDASLVLPIEGNWELVENRLDSNVVKPLRPQQFKVFRDGFFSFMMYNADGSFHGSGAGAYSLDGNQYKETFRYYNDTTWIGYADQQTWALRGDTLIFSGFRNVFDRNGNEMPANTWGGDKFVEKHVRAKP